MAKREYAGKVVVITGAGSGIGRALAKAYCRKGAKLALSDVNLAAVQETVASLGKKAEAKAFRLDVSDRDAVFAHAAEVADTLGPAFLVVNNAGVAVHGAAGELSDKDMHWLMDINFWGVVHGTQAFLPQLTQTRGQLANVSSVFGLIASPKEAIYNASKFGVRGFSESLRMELKMSRTPVSVSIIHPGGIKTAIARSARVTSSENAAHVAKSFDKVAVTSPRRAARIIARGLGREKKRILVGEDAVVIAALPRLLGARYEALVVAANRRAGV